MNKRIYIQIELLIILLALAIGINFQLPALINKYVINGDARQHIYWMQQFRDSGLFRNDLLTEYANNYQPWGFIFLYYLLSFIINPIIIGKILSSILFAISSLYVFKLVKYITTNYTGFLAALIFMITPTYLNRMDGGLPRAFGYPLVIIFLYYLIKKEYLKSSLTLVLQSLFYPMIFFIGMLTYLFTFIKIENKKISLDKSIGKRKFFIYAVLISVFILCGKYILSYNPSIGTTVSRKQMVGDPAYYVGGRLPVLPISPLLRGIARTVDKGTFLSNILIKYPENILIKSGILNGNGLFFITILFLLFEIFRKKLSFHSEILFLFLSSVLMYEISNLLLLKIFLPMRYLEYSVPIISLIVYSTVIGQLITKLKDARTKKGFQIIVITLVLLNYNIREKNMGLIDMSRNKDLYEYLNSLPKDVMIAAHPYLADGIPTFARRKVFIKYELSHPYFDKYWEIIKNRTFDFFNAYYSEDLLSIYKFCEENRIDYLVVHKWHFTKEYLMSKRIYFEPFNSYVIHITKRRRNFALKDIPEEDKLFAKDDIFVIKKPF